uniref:Uncharacterized protein n=1 Tax=Arundo donax TaxID=35708 RepID=A0A0A9GKW4_ARUDO
MILMGTTLGISSQCSKTCQRSTFTSLGLLHLASRRKPGVLLAKTIQNQWLIMRLQAKSVERGWVKLMRRVALMATLPKERPQAWREEKCPMLTKIPIHPLLSY